MPFADATPFGDATSPPGVLPQTYGKRLAERLAAGTALRERCSRRKQARWQTPANRPDPIDLLIASNHGRIERLLPIRYGRMAPDPFAFYRGAAALMAADLAQTPSTGLAIQICGDCHLLNFGGFASAERKVIFDINDFDETSIAPWEWDIKRLATSFVIAGRSIGLDPVTCRLAAFEVAASYRWHMWRYVDMAILDVWYEEIDLRTATAMAQTKQARQLLLKEIEKATTKPGREKEFAKLAVAGDDVPRILDQPPLIFHDAAALTLDEDTVASYLATLQPDRRILLNRFTLADVAFKVVGVGSVGTFCGVALFVSGSGEPLFLQFKEALPSVLEPYAGASPYAHAGERVVIGQRIMQASSDIFLGWLTGAGEEARQYYMRQLKDMKIKPTIEGSTPTRFNNYARLCGHALARAHARSADVAVLAGYLGKSDAFAEAIADFGVAYADQTERDHAELVAAIRSGRIVSEAD
jgi:uncharacterized protein (DUF2252 family)